MVRRHDDGRDADRLLGEMWSPERVARLMERDLPRPANEPFWSRRRRTILRIRHGLRSLFCADHVSGRAFTIGSGSE